MWIFLPYCNLRLDKHCLMNYNICIDTERIRYRDLKNARFVYFAQNNHFSKNGYKILNAKTEIPAHKKYLTKIGFVETPSNSGKFIKNI